MWVNGFMFMQSSKRKAKAQEDRKSKKIFYFGMNKFYASNTSPGHCPLMAIYNCPVSLFFS